MPTLSGADGTKSRVYGAVLNDKKIHDIWGSSAANIYLVGDNGSILHHGD